MRSVTLQFYSTPEVIGDLYYTYYYYVYFAFKYLNTSRGDHSISLFDSIPEVKTGSDARKTGNLKENMDNYII